MASADIKYEQRNNWFFCPIFGSACNGMLHHLCCVLEDSKSQLLRAAEQRFKLSL